MKELALVMLSFFGISAFVFLLAKAFIWLTRQSEGTQIKITIFLLVIIIDIAVLILLFG